MVQWSSEQYQLTALACHYCSQGAAILSGHRTYVCNPDLSVDLIDNQVIIVERPVFSQRTLQSLL